MTARRFFVILILLSLSLLSVLFISNTVKAQTETEPADNFQLQAYLTEEQALSLVFPECDEILTDEFVMSPEEKSSLEKLLSRRSYEDGFRVYIGKKKGILQGYAIITEEIGKFHPFTFVVGVGTDGKISNVAVLVYRESRGGEIAKKRFLYQFMGKSFKNPIRINKDIINITGATMSVQCMCAGVRKVLAVVDEYYLSGKRNVSDLKVVSGNAVTSAKDKPIEEINKSQNAKNNETPPSLKGESGGLSEVKLLKQTRMIMGTFAEVTVYSNDEKTAGKAIEGALDEMGRMDRIMSNYKKDSELSRLNRNAVKAPVPCGAELLDVIEKSQYYSELSDGAFDITISPFVALWGFFDEKGHIPPNKEIDRLLPAVSYKNIVISKSVDPKKPSTVFLKNTQTQIDLGAIGKGYAVDKALEIIKNFGIDNACVNLGGNIYVLGASAGKNTWKIGVQHPRNKDEILGYLELKNEATATSGDYER
ncbi:MAG TPA: FAD:protein FMN transferase, partial [Candidatus Brocadiaceae bacterium]